MMEERYDEWKSKKFSRRNKLNGIKSSKWVLMPPWDSENAMRLTLGFPQGGFATCVILIRQIGAYGPAVRRMCRSSETVSILRAR